MKHVKFEVDDFWRTWTYVHVRYYAVARPSVVCLSVVGNAHAPILRRLQFSAIFLRHLVLGHTLTRTENFMEIVPGDL